MRKNRAVETYLFSSDKERIVGLLLKMGTLTRSALNDAMEAFLMADEALALKVVSGDDEIDAVDKEMDTECLRSIAMRQPVREELRFIFAVLKTTTDLERIGDQSVNIAQWVAYLKKYPRLPVDTSLTDMGDIAGAMLRDALEAFRTEDGSLSEEIRRRDEQLDRMHANLFEESLARMALHSQSDGMFHALAAQMWVARHLERIGDHVKNIVERVYFMDRGESLTKN